MSDDGDASAAEGDGTRVRTRGRREPLRRGPAPPRLGHDPSGRRRIYGDAEGQAMTEWRHEAATIPTTCSERAEAEPHHGHSRPYQILTLLGLVALAVLTLVFDTDIGFTSLTIGFVLSLIGPQYAEAGGRPDHLAGDPPHRGVSTYVGVLQGMGTIDYVGESVAGLASPLVAALLLCLIGAIVSAFASSTAVLGSIIPLAVPFLSAGPGSAPSGSWPPWRSRRRSLMSARSRPTARSSWPMPRAWTDGVLPAAAQLCGRGHHRRPSSSGSCSSSCCSRPRGSQ